MNLDVSFQCFLQCLTPSRWLPEEDIKRALEDCNDSDSESASSDDSSSSSDSSFAKACDQEDADMKKPGSKAKAKAKAKSSAKKQKTEEKNGGKPLKQSASKEKEVLAKLAASVMTHVKTADLLREISCESIWRSTIRSAELERRLTKGNSTISELETLMAHVKFPELEASQQDDAKKVVIEIKDLVFWQSAMKECSRSIRNKDAAALAADITDTAELVEQFAKCAPILFKDISTLADMMHQLAKKLIEVTWFDSRLPFRHLDLGKRTVTKGSLI